jgi:hypothetical protein
MSDLSIDTKKHTTKSRETIPLNRKILRLCWSQGRINFCLPGAIEPEQQENYIKRLRNTMVPFDNPVLSL